MDNIDKFISEAKTYFVKRGWVNDTLFQLNDGLIVYISYFSRNTKTGNYFYGDDSAERYIKWIMEHMSNLWIKYKLGNRKLRIDMNTYSDRNIVFMVNKFGVPTKI